MGALQGKVAFVTGAGRGQGRSHAVRLAEEGADIIAVDCLQDIDTVPYGLATPDDLAQTAKLIEATGRSVLYDQADIRDLEQLRQVAARGVEEFGRIDILCANAGVCSASPALAMSEDMWDTMIDVNLTGAWKTVKAVVPTIVSGHRGGSVIITSSMAGVIGMANMAHYCAAKHGLIGLMRVLAIELAPENIRVNTVNPSNVDTDMLQNAATRELLTGDPNATPSAMMPTLTGMHALNIPWVDPQDVSNLVAWLASDEARFITNTVQLIDGGATAPFKIPHQVTAI